MSELVYVLPVHNEERILATNVRRLQERKAGTLYLVENGSRDRSWEIAQSLESPPDVRAFREADAGIGYAYHRGIEEALRAFGPSTDHWAVLTAADLPFGFSDLEAAGAHIARGERILIGSKAHRGSRVEVTMKRRAMSAAYRVARRAILGMRVGDSQGSVFLRLDLAAEIAPKVASRNFFYTTELCHYAERSGERIIEVPVALEKAERGSTVKPWKHGTEMARQLWDLRRRGQA